MDAQYHVTDKLKETQSTLANYFEQALNTPTGKKVRDFYAQGAKQAIDIHNEAKRLSELRKQHAQKEGVSTKDETSICTCEGNEGLCKCPPGTCTCTDCKRAGQKEKVSQVGTQNVVNTAV